MTTTRGFTGRRRARADSGRVPPGQYVTEDFPVLSAGPTPRTPLDRWTLALQDGGSLAGKWTWDEFQALPRTEVTVDIHCVTKWRDRKSTRLNSSHANISYAVFCLKKKKKTQ